MNKFKKQNDQYVFPYHHIPHFNEKGVVSLLRKLSWGFEYLCYQLHVKYKLEEYNPGSVLEVGCGDGFFISQLSSKIPIRKGIDLSSKAIGFAKAFDQNVHFEVIDISDLNEKFDVIAAIEVLEHIPDLDMSKFLQDVFFHLNENGLFFISVPSNVTPVQDKHYRHYDLKMLESHLNNAGLKYDLVEKEYLFKVPKWLGFYYRIFFNRYYTLEFNFLNKFIWNIIWRKYRVGNVNNAKHLFVIIKKCKI